MHTVNINNISAPPPTSLVSWSIATVREEKMASQMKGMALGRDADISKILSTLEKGTIMMRFYGRKGSRPEKYIYCLKAETMEILQFVIASSPGPLVQEYLGTRPQAPGCTSGSTQPRNADMSSEYK